MWSFGLVGWGVAEKITPFFWNSRDCSSEFSSFSSRINYMYVYPLISRRCERLVWCAVLSPEKVGIYHNELLRLHSSFVNYHYPVMISVTLNVELHSYSGTVSSTVASCIYWANYIGYRVET